jgi:hypothetical protein
MTMDALARFRLDGKVAVVTGAARGIGFAVAELLAKAGADLALIDLNAELGPAAAEKVGASGRRTVFYAADLREPAASVGLVDKVAGDFGRIDILVNCVGINPNTDVLEISPEEWREVQDVNVNAMFFTNQAFARHMAKHGGGSIVAIGSNSGFTVDKPQPQAHYNPRQRRRPRLHPHRDDQTWPEQARVGRGLGGNDPDEALRRAGRDRPRRAVPRERRGELLHRHHPAGGWRLYLLVRCCRRAYCGGDPWRSAGKEAQAGLVSSS